MQRLQTAVERWILSSKKETGSFCTLKGCRISWSGTGVVLTELRRFLRGTCTVSGIYLISASLIE
jgi:hypothetical protein